ncbi:MAG: DUF5060 domain-containing protein [Chloroflexi bacterium]|nr:DUF5060 domain-containing protein [Chloroflexota bacterium]MBP8059960.1 DUF5060 domain-containing protein [Chloroflexota bacterium]
MVVPGLGDGQEAWRVRFTPSPSGPWSYQLTIRNQQGISLPAEESFLVPRLSG